MCSSLLRAVRDLVARGMNDDTARRRLTMLGLLSVLFGKHSTPLAANCLLMNRNYERIGELSLLDVFTW